MTDSFRYQHAAWKLFGIIAADKVKNSLSIMKVYGVAQAISLLIFYTSEA